jgi:hypothetical protein
MSTRPRFLVILLALAVHAIAPWRAGAATTKTFDGVVTHVSVNNIKVRASSGQELSFLIVPRFDNVFKANGTTPVQMKDIKAGNYARIYYDQSALGARHADKILVDTHPFKSLNS